MKTWKMAGCLLLLCVIICGCVVMGKSTEVSAAQTQPSNGEQQETGQAEQTPEAPAPAEKEQAQGGSVTVNKSYSEGLYFRSNGDGTCAVSGIGSCSAACILIPPKSPAGDSVTEILPYALAGSGVTAVELPTTVTVLTGASFAKCDQLCVVRVANGSTAFAEYDGVLYTADGSTLLYCPADRTATDLHLHPALQRIAAGAFSDCKRLAVVYFTGSTAEWHALTVGDENDALYGASFRFNAQ